MNLQEFANKEGKKTIITDSVANVNRLLRRYVRQGETCIYAWNAVTIAAIAKELVMAYCATYEQDKEVQVISSNMQAMRLNIMMKHKEYDFLNEGAKELQTAEEILRVMGNLRMGTPTEAYLQCEEPKILGLKQIIADYEAGLEKEKEVDQVMLLRLAIMILQKCENPRMVEYLISEFANAQVGSFLLEEVSDLEAQFLELLEKKSAKKIEALSVTASDIQRNPHFYKAYGMSNEVRYLAEQILSGKMRFGDVAILYPTENYEKVLLAELDAFGIPYTFPKGFRAANTDYIQLMLNILDFADGDFEYKKLQKVMHNNVLRLSKGIEAFEHFIRAGIGYGRQRYLDYFEFYADFIKENPEEKLSSEECQGFIAFLKELIACFGDNNSTEVMFRSLIKLAQKYTSPQNLYRNCLKDTLESYAKVFSLTSGESMRESIGEIRKYFTRLKCSTAEDAGKVVILPYGTREVIDRKNLFVLGMSNENIASTSAESPVLSDGELRKYVASGAKFALERNKRKREAFEWTYAFSGTETVYVSYSYYDTVALLENSPALLYMEWMDKAQVTEAEDISYELNHMPMILNLPELEKVQLNLETEVSPETTGQAKGTPEQEQGEASSIEEEQEQQEESVPQKRVYSASSLQDLVYCPMKFYYSYIRRVSKVEFQDRKPETWLPANEKGNLFHHVMEGYVNEAIIKNDNSEFDEKLFEQLFAEEAKRAKRENPIPSTTILEDELEEGKVALVAYIEELLEELKSSDEKKKIIGCEIAFENLEYSGKLEELGLEYGILLKGFVDRMDGYVDDQGTLFLEIYDYKTGSYLYKQTDILEGFQFQHYVYALAMLDWAKEHQAELETRFGKSIKQICLGDMAYIFPFEETDRRKLNAMIPFKPGLEVRLPENVDMILALTEGNLAQGKEEDALKFAREYAGERKLNKKDMCQYCNYKDICRV